jgi:hypothetical protein
MNANKRIALAAGTFLLLGVLALLGWSYHSRQAAPGQAAGTLTVNVTSPNDQAHCGKRCSSSLQPRARRTS